METYQLSAKDCMPFLAVGVKITTREHLRTIEGSQALITRSNTHVSASKRPLEARGECISPGTNIHLKLRDTPDKTRASCSLNNIHEFSISAADLLTFNIISIGAIEGTRYTMPTHTR